MTPSNANTSGLGDAGLSETYCFAYESIRNGAPGLSDATCAAIARSINMKVSLSTISRATAAEARADRLADSNEGLTEDLYQAVLVAYRRGAHEWAWLNYPQWRNALAAGQEVAPIARAALQQETQP